MQNKLRFIVFAFLSFAAICGSAQRTVVNGVVVDKINHQPIPGAILFFVNTKTGTSADVDGKFQFNTYYSSDTLVCNMVGYTMAKVKIQQGKSQTITIEMVTDAQLDKLVVRAKDQDPPSIRIMKRVLANKKINNREKLDAYEYEAYNKVEFDLNNIKEGLEDKKLLKAFDFVFDHIDTTQEKNYLPIFMTESLSDFYYRREPKISKEVVKGARVSGVENESVNQFLGDMYQNINIYENELVAFNKSFTSPISSYCFGFYDYFLEDSLWVNNKWCYKISFKPKRRQELLFEGTLWIHDTTYAVKRVEAAITESANINWISHFSVFQEYEEVEPEVWMLSHDKLLVDFNFADKKMGMYGRKSSSYRNFVINKPRENGFYSGYSNIVVNEDSGEKSEEYWNQHRHIALSKEEVRIYEMVDTLKSLPQFNTVVNIINLFVNGYKVVGKLELGPYYTFYSFNPIEGNRLRLGGRTSNEFSKKLMLEGYVAYGFKDHQWKGGGGFLYVFQKAPRMTMQLNAKHDMEQLGQGNGALRQDNVLSSVFRRNPASKLTMVEEVAFTFEREWLYGLSNKAIVKRRTLYPAGSTFVYKNTDGSFRNSLNTTEFTLLTRFAFKEKFVYGEFLRMSMGTNWPEFEISYTWGRPNILGSEFHYGRAEMSMYDKWRFGPFGYMNTTIKAGKIYGQLPYPMLMMHQGNETFFYDEASYNTMNYFEFVSDRWASVWCSYHMEGLLLNKVPVMRRLKWREVLSAKAVVGGYDERNDILLSRDWNGDGINDIYTLKQPYVEAAVGVENIFKVLRLDMLYRLSYLDHPNIFRYGIRAKLQFDF
jgi:hypothetical protein